MRSENIIIIIFHVFCKNVLYFISKTLLGSFCLWFASDVRVMPEMYFSFNDKCSEGCIPGYYGLLECDNTEIILADGMNGGSLLLGDTKLITGKFPKHIIFAL